MNALAWRAAWAAQWHALQASKRADALWRDYAPFVASGTRETRRADAVASRLWSLSRRIGGPSFNARSRKRAA